MAEGASSGLQCRSSEWRTEGDEIVRVWVYDGLTGMSGSFVVKIVVKPYRSSLGAKLFGTRGALNSHVFVLTKPATYRTEGYLVLRLSGQACTVKAGFAADGSALLTPVEREGADLVVRSLRKGGEQQIELFSDSTAPQLSLPVPVGAEFEECYSQLSRRL